MGLNLAILVGCEWSSLLENIVVNSNLADIVEQPGEVEVATFLRRHLQLFRQTGRNPCDALGMPGGVGILGVDRGGQGSDDSEEQFLELDVGPGIAGLRGDERRHVLHALDIWCSDESIVQRLDGDKPSRRAGRNTRKAVQRRC